MARMTNAQLVDENIRLREQCNALEHQLASEKARHDARVSTAKPLVRRYERAPHQLPAHMAAARELAMRTGHSVKVGA